MTVIKAGISRYMPVLPRVSEKTLLNMPVSESHYGHVLVLIVNKHGFVINGQYPALNGLLAHVR